MSTQEEGPDIKALLATSLARVQRAAATVPARASSQPLDARHERAAAAIGRILRERTLDSAINRYADECIGIGETHSFVVYLGLEEAERADITFDARVNCQWFDARVTRHIMSVCHSQREAERCPVATAELVYNALVGSAGKRSVRPIVVGAVAIALDASLSGELFQQMFCVYSSSVSTLLRSDAFYRYAAARHHRLERPALAAEAATCSRARLSQLCAGIADIGDRKAMKLRALESARQCAHCGDAAFGMSFCSVCHRACYCGAKCQRAHWRSGHAKRCGARK